MKSREPDIFNVILATNPHMSNDILVTFERIGRREIYPYLLVDGSPGSRMLSALPYDTQVRLYNDEVPVVVRSGDFTTTLRKRVPELSSREAALVFDGARVRPVTEQTRIIRNAQDANRQKKSGCSDR